MFQLILTVLLYTSFDLYKARVFNARIAPKLVGLVYYNRLGPPCTCADDCDNIIDGCPLWLHKKHNPPDVP